MDARERESGFAFYNQADNRSFDVHLVMRNLAIRGRVATGR
jgi:hypothetical protein